MKRILIVAVFLAGTAPGAAWAEDLPCMAEYDQLFFYSQAAYGGPLTDNELDLIGERTAESGRLYNVCMDDFEARNGQSARAELAERHARAAEQGIQRSGRRG